MRADVDVLIADDHPVFRLGLALALRQLGFGRVVAVEDGEQAVQACEMESFDVVILDVKMPRMNGFDVVRALKSGRGVSPTEPKIVIMSAFEQPAVLRAGAELGVDSYVGKEIEPVRLAVLIDALLQGKARTTTSPSTTPLTSRERQVLHHLCRGCSTKAIASVLEISPETVKDHLANLYAKLDVRDRAAAVHVAHQLGWVALDDLDDEGRIGRASDAP